MPRLDDVSIRARIYLLGLVALAGLVAVLFMTIDRLEQTMREDARVSARLVVEAADSLLAAHAAREQSGEMSRAEAQTAALRVLAEVRYGSGGLLWVDDLSGPAAPPLLPPRGAIAGGEAADVRLARAVEAVRGSGAGVVRYGTGATAGEAYVRLFEPWGWVVGTPVHAEAIAGTIRQTIVERTALVASVAVIMLILGLLLGRSIAEPITAITVRMRALAAGDEISPIPHADRRDEIGQMAKALVVFREALRNNVALRKARDEATAADAAKSEFLANMSHELRTPLNSIVGFATLLEHSPRLSGPEARYARLVRTASETLLEIVNDVIDFSKLGAGGVALQLRDFRPADLIADTVALMQGQAARKGLALTIEARGPGELRLRGDAGRIRQVLLNLLGNAVKFTETGGVRVRATTETRPDGQRAGLRIEVIDTGVGIPPEHMDRLFQRFFQGDGSAARRHGGSGLGLPISKAFVELMDGQMGVTSAPGQGSTFWFELETAIATGKPTTDEAQDGPRASDARVLVVDDVEVNRELVGIILRRWGCQVDEAAGGAAAIVAAASGRYDIVLMDLHMPEMDGAEATRRMREAGVRTPIVAMTADVIPERIADCLAAGMTDYLAKPIEPVQLGRMLARCCPHRVGMGREPPTAPAGAMLHGELGEPAARSLLLKFARLLRTSFPDDGRVADRSRLGEAAHALRGVAGMLGFPEVEAACARLERASASGEETGKFVIAARAACADALRRIENDRRAT